MKAVWIVLVITFLVLEGYAIRTGKHTLSATWLWLREIAPTPVAIAMLATLGAVFLWLFAIHWLFTIIDKPGLDRLEITILLLGAILGGISGALAKRKETNLKANAAVALILGIDTEIDCQEAYNQYRSTLDVDKFREDVEALIAGGSIDDSEESEDEENENGKRD